MLQEFTTVYKCVSGSHAYGTSTEHSDVDIRGVAVPAANYLVGLGRFEQKDKWPDKVDRTIFSLTKFIELALKANPNILELLFMPEDCIILTSDAWQGFVDMRTAFLSKKIQHTYGGYAFSQLKRIRSHRQWLINPPTHEPTREEFGLPGRKLPMDLFGVLQALEQSHQAYVEDAQGLTELGVTNPGAIWEFYQNEKKYNLARKNWSQYMNWKKTRNPARAELEAKFGYDTKHASHLIRLLNQGLEILNTGSLSVRLQGANLDEVVAVRSGAFTYDQIEAMAEAQFATLESAAKESTLPFRADFNRVEAELMRVLQRSMMFINWASFDWYFDNCLLSNERGCGACAHPCV